MLKSEHWESINQASTNQPASQSEALLLILGPIIAASLSPFQHRGLPRHLPLLQRHHGPQAPLAEGQRQRDVAEDRHAHGPPGGRQGADQDQEGGHQLHQGPLQARAVFGKGDPSRYG